MRIAHLIPEGSAYRRRGKRRDPEEVCSALCGVEVVRYKDDGYYFTPSMAEHRNKVGYHDNWCPRCREELRAGDSRRDP